MSLRLIIADDEAPLRDWLRRLLHELAPDMTIVAEAADGLHALDLIETLQPDAALLDIRMPGLSGLALAQRLETPCRLVFVTAYDQFAVQAFEHAAVDYLLKPVTPERLAITLSRLRQPAPEAPQDVLQQLITRLGPAHSSPLRWLRVGNGNSLRLLDVMEVDHFEAADKYTLVHVGHQEWLIRLSLKELEQQLDPEIFWRIHRSSLVRVAAIREVNRDLMGRLSLTLHGSNQELPISRSYAHLFRQM